MAADVKVRITFTNEVLGTCSANPDIHSEFIASKAPDAETRDEELARLIENDGLDEAIERNMTVFPRMKDDPETPVFFNYQFKGFFKEAARMMKKVPKSRTSGMKAYLKEIDGLIFVYGTDPDDPNNIPIRLSGEMGVCQRPLRASTAQGERVALASSETVPAGSWCDIIIRLLNPDDWKYVEEWLTYGQYHGMLQWRNSGKGTFIYKVLE